jgi:hypothetical protein
MKKLLFAFFALSGSASAHPSSTDTVNHVIILAPARGDSYQELQAAIDFCIDHPGYRIHLENGDFYISHPLIVAKIVNKDYGQVSIDMEGAAYAKNSQPAYTSNIITTFTNGFAIGMQLNKGSVIRNIHFQGKFRFPNTLSQIEVDTLPFDKWKDGICRDTRTSPYAAIVIDPFGDRAYYNNPEYTMYPGLEKYYLPGMDRAGSTAINISGCSIYDFVVGVLVTAAFQYNGELINVTDCRIDNCKVCYAYSQAQSKANTLFDLMVWGGVHTIVDGASYGFYHNDASTGPFVDVMNVAGSVHQLFNVYASTFPFSAKRVYAESLFKIGIVRGLVGAHFDDFQVDFGNSGYGFPSPDFYYEGYNTTWTSCMLRLYNGLPERLVLDFPTNTFTGGSMNAPPLCWNTTEQMPTFTNVGMFYYKVASSVLNSNNYDTRAYVEGPGKLHVNRSDFSGWCICRNIAQVSVGDIWVTSKRFEDQYPLITGCNYPVGFVTAIKRDTVFLQNVGVGIHNGDSFTIVDCKIKGL